MKLLGLLLVCVALPVVRCHDPPAGAPVGFLHGSDGSPLKSCITSLKSRRNDVDPDGELLFITNHRTNVLGGTEEPIRPVSFDEADNDPSASVRFCQSGTDQEHQEIFSGDLLKRLLNSKAEHVLFSIHGFNTQPTSALDQAANIQGQFNTMAERGDDASTVKVVGLIWPCGDKWLYVRDYWDDRRSAYASATGFERMLAKVLRAEER